MNDVPPASPALITFSDPDERRGLPVAFAAEPVPVRHQALHGEAGKLRQAVQVLEGIRERLEAARLEKSAQTRLDPRGVPQ